MKFGVRVALGILTSSLCLSVYFLFHAPTGTRARAATPQQPPTVKASTHTGGGLRTTTFDTPHGRVVVHLPDDMRAGDTVSGTAVAEPKGVTEEERGRSSGALKNFVVEIAGTRVSGGGGMLGGLKVPVGVADGAGPGGGSFFIVIKNSEGTEVANSRAVIVGAPAATGANQPTGPAPTSDPRGVINAAPDNFVLPKMGQQGRPVEVFGPFDGDTSNTTLRFGPAGSTLQDFEKNTENVSGGFGPLRPLAESPRKVVFESPNGVSGPVEIVVREGGLATTGTYRSVGVRLSAPKTNLLRGERTTLTVEVSGLQGIKEDAPLQLDARGVVQMEGGNFQNLRIRPQEVKADGRYITTRGITGQQAGAFTVTATVVVRPFDVCLQDDTQPGNVMMWNTFNGSYYIPLMTHRGVRPAGQTQTAGAGQVKPTDAATPAPPGGLGLTGTGKVAMKGCIITLSHNAPERRVFARLDACTNTGSATVETTSPKTIVNITDTNTNDNVCTSK